MSVPNPPPVKGPDHEPTPEFDSQLVLVFDRWERSELPARDAIARMEAMSREAQADGQAANQGRAELLLGVVQGYRANLDASIRHFERARALFEQAGNRSRALGCVLNLGESYRLQGNFTRARQLFRAASEAAREIGEADTEAIALCNDGLMLLSLDQPENALAVLTKAREIARLITVADDREELECEIEYGLASTHLRLNDAPAAWTHALAARELAGRYPNQPLLAGLANRGLGEVLTALGALPEGSDASLPADADTYFQTSIEAFQSINADGEAARSVFTHALSLAARQQGVSAARKLQQAMIIFTRLGMTDDAAKAAQAQMRVLSGPAQE